MPVLSPIHTSPGLEVHVQLQSLGINDNVHSCLIHQIGGGPASLRQYLYTCHNISHQLDLTALHFESACNYAL